jgi:hypothetical protein
MLRSILFSPFVPFTVLFCHAIETINEDDITLMGHFVDSIKEVSRHPGPLANHHRLFEVFHAIAKRYYEVQTSPGPSQPYAAELRTRMGDYLGSLGVGGAHPGQGLTHGEPTAVGEHSQMGVGMFSEHADFEGNGEQQGYDQAMQLGNWFTLNQQMMDLLGNDHLPF